MITKLITTTTVALLLLPEPSTIIILTEGGGPPRDEAGIVAAYASARAWWGLPKQAVGVDVAPLPPDALSVPPVYPEGTVVILETDGLLMGQFRGLAAPNRIWVVSGAQNLGAVFAHEIGHAWFGLEHWEDCLGLDIMCSPDAAYAAQSVGCRSLEALERPCSTIYLPSVGH